MRTGQGELAEAYRELEPKLHEGEASCEPADRGARDEVREIHEDSRAHEDAVEQQRAPVVSRHACQQGLVSLGHWDPCPQGLAGLAARLSRSRAA